jgi:Tol biopolymer transport system component
MGLFLKSVGHKREIVGGFVVLAAALTFSVSSAWATLTGANGRIAYTSGYDLHTVLPSGRGDKTIATPAYDSAWSPNGKWLAFTGFAPDATGSDIFAMRADGTDERRLTDYGNNPFGYGWTNTPSYSPGGGRIVFLSTGYKSHTSITTMRNDGSDWQYPLPYSDRGAGDSVWSPGGEIAYGEGGKPRSSIWAMNPDGSNQHLLVYLGKDGGSGPIYSPDGSEFLFLRYRADRSIAVRLANADGGDVRPPPCEPALTTMLGYGTAGLFPIAYSPDARWLVVSRYEGSTRKVDLLRLSLSSCSRKVIVRDVTGAAAWQSLPRG